ncbi:type II toxin-antitoxin system RelB/DinJ family antitoxin [Bradyrhizobium neotropicale]|uniref:type II toxin-antitoxin system RelB/DinJ family antitoxin n=1 Tax=Bradyrhizobium neotropicale TaxID=1497615 RepID=UPI001AD7C697|nr:type II toxin-antitoxin system RelB/DinJ family antitoxin [Bradyrhizobium neotropicale]MBO4228170.1 type II toxin-antitoxin system RelB/DinJ family antitoxin [Bradyrhizobium neotropicale]
MAKTATINARIEPVVKSKAEKVFAAIGISASDAIGLFYRQVAFRKGLPFDVCIPNATTLAALHEAESGGGEVVHGSTQDIFNDILNEE